jgi:regulation of enolase protein 1 (concanavalin A-like superfamily)
VVLREDGVMSDSVTIAPLPAPLDWDVAPASWSLDAGPALTIVAPAVSDLFTDPAGGEPKTAAPRLLGRVEGDFQFSARVQSTFAAAFDAGALLLWTDERRWVKLAFEVSPQGEPGVVSVVTDGRSDDATAFDVSDGAVWLRVSRIGAACAMHARRDGERWRFVRHFALAAPAGLRAGFLAQSPTGDGATARFDEIAFVPKRLPDLRSGE